MRAAQYHCIVVPISRGGCVRGVGVSGIVYCATLKYISKQSEKNIKGKLTTVQISRARRTCATCFYSLRADCLPGFQDGDSQWNDFLDLPSLMSMCLHQRHV